MKTLKKHKIKIIFVVALTTIILIGAEFNWRQAVKAAKKTELTDGAISEALHQYGFHLDWHETPTAWEKIKAIF